MIKPSMSPQPIGVDCQPCRISHVLFSVIKQRGCGLFSCEQVDISASAVQVDYFGISGGPTFFLANSRGEFKWVSV